MSHTALTGRELREYRDRLVRLDGRLAGLPREAGGGGLAMSALVGLEHWEVIVVAGIAAVTVLCTLSAVVFSLVFGLPRIPGAVEAAAPAAKPGGAVPTPAAAKPAVREPAHAMAG